MSILPLPVRMLVLSGVVALSAAMSPATAEAANGDCAQPVTNGTKPTASDCLYILRTAVNAVSCEICVCDANGSTSITATDALVCLKVAVNQPVQLNCPDCVISTTTTTTTSTSSSSSSTTSTTVPFCGDGFLDFGEECDDGNLNNGDGCNDDCLIEAGTCVDDADLLCDDEDTWDTLEDGSTDVVNFYGCREWLESGREYTYLFEPDVNENVLVQVTSEFGVDHDVFVLIDDGFGCTPGNCIASGDSEAAFLAAANETYYIVVDGFEGDAGAFTIDLFCQ